jgi:RNA polymerase sigma-70 factor (ECF subfamily)
LIDRVRAGDSEAATEIVRTYEPAIRRAIRIRLTDARLRRVLETMDICQSVFASFFVRAALGQFDLDSPDQLVKLLVTIARRKLTDQVRHELADCRDGRRLESPPVDERAIAARDTTPSQAAETADLIVQVRRQLTPEDRYLAEQRALGRPWQELADELHSSPESLRKRLVRAVRIALDQLGVESIRL